MSDPACDSTHYSPSAASDTSSSCAVSRVSAVSPLSAVATHPLAKRIIAGERRALAQGITLIESTRADHKSQADILLTQLLPQTGGAVRIGVSGTPGVGKSTFIEVLGLFLVGLGKRVAVLAVDPSSVRTGGSILGDKTRMEGLACHPDAFIRPSPSGGTLGGVARRTRESLLLCEAAGFDVVIVETVGVGQSEVAVAGMSDIFLLMLAPAAGDELQGMKRGVMELADLVIVNKADGDFRRHAERSAGEYRAALHLMRPKSPHWSARVLLVSALEERGIEEVWAVVQEHRAALGSSGEREAQRVLQAKDWMWREVVDAVETVLRTDVEVAPEVAQVEWLVLNGELLPTRAAQHILQTFCSLSGKIAGRIPE